MIQNSYQLCPITISSMQQLRLVQPEKYIFDKAVSYSHISAEFKKMSESFHEVLLEINSHKFVINMRAWLKKLEQFEVLAVKWCVELWMKMIMLLKRIVTTLYFEY